MGAMTTQQHFVLDTAWQLFSERGYGKVTMHDIARMSGISRRTLYDRFPSKGDILVRLVQRVGRRACVLVRTHAPTTPQELAQTLVDLVDIHLPVALLIHGGLRADDQALWKHLDRWHHRALLRIIAALLGHPSSLGMFRRPVDGTVTTLVIAAAIDAPFLLAGTGTATPRPLSARTDILTTLAVLLEGLIAPGGEPAVSSIDTV